MGSWRPAPRAPNVLPPGATDMCPRAASAGSKAFWKQAAQGKVGKHAPKARSPIKTCCRSARAPPPRRNRHVSASKPKSTERAPQAGITGLRNDAVVWARDRQGAIGMASRPILIWNMEQNSARGSGPSGRNCPYHRRDARNRSASRRGVSHALPTLRSTTTLYAPDRRGGEQRPAISFAAEPS